MTDEQMPDADVLTWLPEGWHRKWNRDEDEGTQEKWESCELMRALAQARKELAETRDRADVLGMEIVILKAERDALKAKIAEDCRGCTDVADLTARLAEAVDCLADVMGYPLSDRDSMWDIVPSGTRKRADRIINREPVRNAYKLPASCADANKDSC